MYSTRRTPGIHFLDFGHREGEVGGGGKGKGKEGEVEEERWKRKEERKEEKEREKLECICMHTSSPVFLSLSPQIQRYEATAVALAAIW